MQPALTSEEQEVLRRALLAEQKLEELAKENRAPLGFGWYDLQCSPWVLQRLLQKGFLKVVSVWRRGLLYRVADVELVKQALNNIKPPSTPENEKIPDDIFSCIEGYDDLKQLLLANIKGDARVHILLWGSPATAKTLFLLELTRLPRSYYIVGSRVSKAGLSRLLLEHQPKFLLVDEIDRIPGKDLGILLSLMETGIVRETIAGGKEAILDTVVFGACNRVDTLPQEIRSRFLEFYFPPYSEEEFLWVATNFLVKREGLDEPTARRVAGFCLRWRDVRKARAVARLFRVMGDRVFEILREKVAVEGERQAGDSALQSEALISPDRMILSENNVLALARIDPLKVSKLQSVPLENPIDRSALELAERLKQFNYTIDNRILTKAVTNLQRAGFLPRAGLRAWFWNEPMPVLVGCEGGETFLIIAPRIE